MITVVLSVERKKEVEMVEFPLRKLVVTAIALILIAAVIFLTNV